jgi:hypothetical protein
MVKEIPTQIPRGGFSEFMLQNGPAVSTATGVILGGNLFANFFVEFSLHSLLEIINTI